MAAYETKAGGESLSLESISNMSAKFRASDKNILAMNAVSRSEMRGVLISRDHAVGSESVHTFSHHLDKEAKVTNQKSSGRCWLFAALNVFRIDMMRKYKLDDFEFSQTYLFWYDKLEKSCWFLDSVIKTADEPLDGRLMQFLLQSPVQDGGQWDMVVNLIEKYGLVPKSAFPESAHSGNTRPLNWLITVQLREGAARLRALVAAHGAASAAVREAKEQILSDVYRIMAITVGEPPRTFDWTFRDKDKVVTTYRGLTPASFYRDHVGRDVSRMISLVNDPRNEYYRLYTVEYLGNVVGGRPVIYVNLPIAELKKYAAAAICGKAVEQLEKANGSPGAVQQQKAVAGEPVWFGCDVGKFSDGTTGVMDMEYYDYRITYDISFGLDKADRLRLGESAMTHAMTLNAVHLDEATLQPLRWRVENSWGEARGEKGFFSMTDGWFEQYVYQIVVDRSLLPPRVADVIDAGEVTALPPWDPLGALA